MLYSFADFNVDLQCDYDLSIFAPEYRTEGTADVTIGVYDEDIQLEKSYSEEGVRCHFLTYMFVAFSRKLADWFYDAFGAC